MFALIFLWVLLWELTYYSLLNNILLDFVFSKR
jgi:hypothetical protein